MATATTAFNPQDCPDDAAFRTQVAALHTALLSVGMVAVTATGSLGIQALTKPTTANTLCPGYLFYRFSDLLQATKPVFLAVQLTTVAYAGAWGWRLTLCTGIDGAGALLNPSPTLYFEKWGNASGGVTTTYLSGGANYLIVAAPQFAASGISIRALLSVERSKDVACADTGAGLLVHNPWLDTSSTGTPQPHSCFYDFTSASPVTPVWGCTMPYAMTGTQHGNNITGAYPLRTFYAGEQAPGLNLQAVFCRDLTPGVVFSVRTYDGNTHAYLPFTSQAWGEGPQLFAPSDTPTVTPSALMIRWE